MSEPIRHVALLLGINVGGHRKISKEQLTEIFTGAGFTSVQTCLASGNVLFASTESDEATLQRLIEKRLSDALGYDVDVMVRTIEYIQELIALDPFGAEDVQGRKFYVTFMATSPEATPELPERLPDQGSVALGLHDREFFAISEKARDGSYGDFSKYIIKTFGKGPVTTRNWNTVIKIAADSTDAGNQAQGG